MIKQIKGSRIEVWNSKYINYPDKRNDDDKNAVIHQIECTVDPDVFIVEVCDDKNPTVIEKEDF